jgi:hypothetical protein
LQKGPFGIARHFGCKAQKNAKQLQLFYQSYTNKRVSDLNGIPQN